MPAISLTPEVLADTLHGRRRVYPEACYSSRRGWIGLPSDICEDGVRAIRGWEKLKKNTTSHMSSVVLARHIPLASQE